MADDDPTAADRAVALFVVTGLVVVAGIAALVGGGTFAVALGNVAESPVGFAGTYVGAYGMIAVTTAGYVFGRGGRSFLDLSPPTTRDLRDVLATYLGVVVAAGVIVGAAALLGLPVFDPSAVGRPVAAPVLVAAIPLSVAVGVPAQELLFRNCCQKRLAEDLPQWGAVGVASLLMVVLTMATFAGAPVLGLAVPALVVAVAATAVGLVYERTGTLVASWLLHASLTLSLLSLLYLDASTTFDLGAVV